MKLKKGLIVTIIIVLAFISFTLITYYGIGYKKISEDTKEKIISIIKSNKESTYDLQTDNFSIKWTEGVLPVQKEMVDKLLNTLTIVGESRKGEPSKYIVMSGDSHDMKVYILYTEKTPYKNIVIKVDGHYYVGTATEDSVKTIVDYMKKAKILK